MSKDGLKDPLSINGGNLDAEPVDVNTSDLALTDEPVKGSLEAKVASDSKEGKGPKSIKSGADVFDELAKDPKQNLKTIAKPLSVGGMKAGGSAFGAAYVFGTVKYALGHAMFMLANIVGAAVNMVVGGATALLSGVAAIFTASVTSAMTGTAVIAVVATIATSVVSSVMSYNNIVSVDDALICSSDELQKYAKSAVKGLESDDEAEARMLEVAQSSYSVLSVVGYSDEQIGAALGNWEHESGGRSKRFESDYTFDSSERESYYTAIDNDGPTVETVWGSWSSFMKLYANTPDSKKPTEGGYLAGNPARHYIGVGLGQWTGGRALALWDFARANNLSIFDLDVQLAFMVSDVDSEKSRSDRYLALSAGKTVDEATSIYLDVWEGVSGNELNKRQTYAAKWAAAIKTFKRDDAYANSILSMANVKVSKANTKTSVLNSKDRCGSVVGDSLEDTPMNGTGVFPADVKGTLWKESELPSSLKKYTFSPASFGYSYGVSSGWAENSGQCVDLTETLGGLVWFGSPVHVTGNGIDQAKAWAAKYGGKTTKYPQSKGAIWSSVGTSAYGHTGILCHVFKDGSILVVEQNVAGLSGEAIGKVNTWNYRYLTKTQYEAEKFEFYSPSGKTAKFSK